MGLPSTSQKQTDLDTKYANWNGWYQDLFEEIRIIRRVGSTLLITPKDTIYQYFSLILNLHSTHSSYMDNNTKLEEKLNALKNKIYNSKFTEALRQRIMGETVIKVISDLIETFKLINESLSSHGITPKVTETEKKNKSKAINEMS